MLININTATIQDVQNLGIAADWAKYIVDYREYVKSNPPYPKGFLTANDFNQMNLPAEYLSVLIDNVTFDDTSEAQDEDRVANDSRTSVGNSPSQPGTLNSESAEYFFVDVSPHQPNPGWSYLINTPNIYGAILWATQGTKEYIDRFYKKVRPDMAGWFKKNWPIVKSIANGRYGNAWFRGAYLFLNLWEDGIAQADNYLDTITEAGGWDIGDIIPIIDVELGNDGTNGKPIDRNRGVSAQEIIDCVTACADRLRSVTGRNIILYGRGAMRDKGINSKMGCDIVWNPCYTPSIVMHGLEAWTLDDVVLWQYCGDGRAALDEKKFPRVIPNFGNADISVYIEGRNKPSFNKLKERLGIGT